MNNHISYLLNFFHNYLKFLKSNNIISDINADNINIDFISKSKQGDVSSNFFLIVQKKILIKNFNIQSDLKSKLKKVKFINYVEISKKGFINIFFKKDFLIDELKNIIGQKQNYGCTSNKKNDDVNIEFVSANPTGPIHIAHIRGAVIGDVLSNILKKTGYNVIKEYYVNDTGTQIEKLGISLYKRYCQLLKVNIKLKENEYPGKYLIDIANDILKRDKDKWLNKPKKNIQEYFESFAINSLMTQIKNDLSLIDIKFDTFSYESNIIKSNLIKKLFLKLKSKNLIYEGVLDKPLGEDVEDWEPRKQLLFRSSALFDNSDRAFKKSNGDWTYFANDSAYHYDKYNRKFSKLINIWGADHIGYIPRMKSLVYSITDDKNYLEILTCQIVRLLKNNKVLKMSKREGNFITLKQVYDSVGKDALRYFMISTRSETSIDFDMNKVIVKNKDNPVFYCQYAYARASSVINKAKKLNVDYSVINNKNMDILKYISSFEWEIILKIISYPYILEQSSEYREPHRITNYLENLSSDFHSFWNKGKDQESLRFINEKNVEKTKAKLLWLESMRIVLKNAFEIIGIESPESM